MAPLSYYWIISFIYLVIAKKERRKLISVGKVESLLSPSFILILSFLLLNRRKKKDMYICSNQVL